MLNGGLETKVYTQKPADFSHAVEVSAIYVNVDGKLLFLQLAPGKAEAGGWGVPAGKLETGETPLKAAKRELYEETGIDVPENLFLPIGLLHIRKPRLDYAYHLFGVNLDGAPTIDLSNEHVAYKWVSRQEAEKLPLMDGARQALGFYHSLPCKA